MLIDSLVTGATIITCTLLVRGAKANRLVTRYRLVKSRLISLSHGLRLNRTYFLAGRVARRFFDGFAVLRLAVLRRLVARFFVERLAVLRRLVDFFFVDRFLAFFLLAVFFFGERLAARFFGERFAFFLVVRFFVATA